MLARASPADARRTCQRERLSLPLLPTTTIGSFPQTAELWRTRAAFRSGTVTLAEYERYLRGEIDRCLPVSFVDSCRSRGLSLPIVPGIMPIANYERLVRFCAAAGVEIPRWLRLRLDGLATDPGSLIAFGVDVIGRLCERLLGGGAPGLHFYTMSRAEPTATLWTQLGLARPEPRQRGDATIPSPRVASVLDPRARESAGSGGPPPTTDRDRLAPAPPARGGSRR
jgi:hypothetical protein